ncbi:MAG: class I SAM-dependent methyltransferase [Moorea sp. SIO3I7]|uniref:class I SAM-dependent methyltransferase n=1 Tax=Moorena sp. SIO3I8 TaxID=2607833 RepID=UPI0013C1ADE5|nr:class I SAM-dependent methyltransferase [Moorena sp. SIO3I8]NEN96039.1 class I SAM-dependent methyltransferase [Moorena sp. SIO3I7]NEO04297.1 class I SAM-dependent methyltransferase [Moorena sp. SIO3I8]
MKKLIIKLLTAGIKNNYYQPTEELSLENAIAQIDHFFGRDSMLKEFDADITVPYYTQSELGYRLYHSAEDAIHMALNFDGVFNVDGYQAQPRIVAEQIDKLGATNVLEVGCGKGFNSLFLAQQFPSVQFVGIDLTPSHIAIANRKVRDFTNLTYQIGDFNCLNFPSQSFDLVFACECLCHAHQPRITLAEIFRILRPGGKLVIFDGYRQAKLESFSQELQTLTQLTEIGMAVQHGFCELEDWTEVAKNVGFSVETREDLTFAIQPTLLRLQSLSLLFFKSYWRSKVLTFLLPKYLVRNAVPGLLMHFAFNTNQGSLGYYKFILKR